MYIYIYICILYIYIHCFSYEKNTFMIALNVLFFGFFMLFAGPKTPNAGPGHRNKTTQFSQDSSDVIPPHGNFEDSQVPKGSPFILFI